MKRFILAACAGLLALAMASPSFAADLPRPAYKAPIYVAPFSWSGFYIGLNGGYGWGDSDWSSAATAGNAKPKGGLIGGTIGYNFQTGVWVWGIEGDFDYSWMKGTDSGGTGVCTGVGCETKNTWFGTARGRVGYSFDRWMPYITGGAAFANVKMTPNTGGSETDNRFGWTAGAGLEYAFAGGWSAKVEYLYADLGKANCSAATCGVSTDVSFKPNIVRVGVNYRF
ncbi:MAG: outer membrane protein [Pseudolabrys sp.]